MKGLLAIVLVMLVLLQMNGVVNAIFDGPPKIILPENLDDPASLTIIGNNSQLVNTLVCAASNAEFIEWKYRKARNTGFEQIPKPFQQGSQEADKNGNIYITLTDQNNDWRLRDDLNGFYQCFARNSKGYTAMTPPIRFILAAIPTDAENYSPRSEAGNKNAPLRLKCIDDRVITKPTDLRMWNVARYSWQIFKPKSVLQESAITPISEDSRIRIDQRTGDLYFAYLKPEDGFGTEDFSPEYQCMITLGVKPGQFTGSRTHLTVTESDEAVAGLVLQTPTQYEEKSIKCIEGNKCLLSCIYGGRSADGVDPSTPVWKQPGATSSVPVAYMFSSVIFTATSDAEGTWTCSHPQSDASEGTIDVTVLQYPKITKDEMLSKFVEVGKEVKFVCNARHANEIEFYINGIKITNSTPLHVKYTEGNKYFNIPSAAREHSASITCIATSQAGILFRTAELNVYNKPNVTFTPPYGYILTSNITKEVEEFELDCSAVLDPKVKMADIHWRTNHTDLKSDRITEKHPIGIKSVTTDLYMNNQIRSKLVFDLDTTTVNTIVGYHWWCVIEMRMENLDTPIEVISDKVPFKLAKKGDTGVTIARVFDNWWIIGVVVALVFFILILILIICCVKHYRGEDYYVDEKERKAGHDPEEELGHYGFHDYKRPATGGYVPIDMSDQDPLKASRASLDVSQKPIDSDNGSMDEYGDIDPGRFNEDGSFIGQYGKSSTQLDE